MDAEAIKIVAYSLEAVAALLTAFALGAVWQHYRERR